MAYYAIPTIYKGIRFKSRLEADMAYLLDFLELRWEYEPQSFLFDNGVHYLPDFFLPQTNTWIECRGYETEKGNKQIKTFSKYIMSGQINGKTMREYCPHDRERKKFCTRKINVKEIREYHNYPSSWLNGINELDLDYAFDNSDIWDKLDVDYSYENSACITCFNCRKPTNYIVLMTINLDYIDLFSECFNKSSIGSDYTILIKCEDCNKYFFTGYNCNLQCRHCGYRNCHYGCYEYNASSEYYNIELIGSKGICINGEPFRKWIEKQNKIKTITELFFKIIKKSYRLSERSK